MMFVLEKVESGWWLRLFKVEGKVLKFVKVDWNKWVDEDEEDEVFVMDNNFDMGVMGGMGGGMGGMDFFVLSGMGGGGMLDFFGMGGEEDDMEDDDDMFEFEFDKSELSVFIKMVMEVKFEGEGVYELKGVEVVKI